jgi:hypothetical protein
MNRLLIRSDHLTVRSDNHAGSASNGTAQTSSQTGARPPPARASAARIADRNLQALRPAELPLRWRTGTRPEAISGHQSTGRAAMPGLRAQCGSRACRPLDRQLSQGSRGAQRDLRDQCRAPASARGSRVGRHGPGPGRLRPGQGRRHSRRHGGLLPRRRCLAVQSGGGR